MLAIVAVLIISQILAAQAESAPPSVQSRLLAVSDYVPRTARDTSFVALTDRGSQLTLAAWSLPSKDQPGFDAGVVAVRGKGKHGKVVWRLKLPGGYSPSLMEKPEFKYRGRPIVLLRIQFGAAATQMLAIGIERGRVTQLGSVDADYFDYVNAADATYLVAHEDVNLFDVPRLCRWSGTTFVDDSENHPEFYRQLANQIRNKSDVTKFAKPAQLRFAQILRLSGEQPPPDR